MYGEYFAANQGGSFVFGVDYSRLQVSGLGHGLGIEDPRVIQFNSNGCLQRTRRKEETQ